jgi:hypothetical protein
MVLHDVRGQIVKVGLHHRHDDQRVKGGSQSQMASHSPAPDQTGQTDLSQALFALEELQRHLFVESQQRRDLVRR